MRRKMQRSEKNDELVKDDESQQYGPKEWWLYIDFTEEEHPCENKPVPAVPVDEDPPESYARARHGDSAAEEHEWKQAYVEVMIE